MPYYSFHHPENEADVIDVFFHMNDVKEYFDASGTKWVRIFHVPNATIDGNIDPWDQNAFLEKTRKGGTVGEAWDISRELSEKRKQEVGTGIDPVSVAHEENRKAEQNKRKEKNSVAKKLRENKPI